MQACRRLALLIGLQDMREIHGGSRRQRTGYGSAPLSEGQLPSTHRPPCLHVQVARLKMELSMSLKAREELEARLADVEAENLSLRAQVRGGGGLGGGMGDRIATTGLRQRGWKERPSRGTRGQGAGTAGQVGLCERAGYLELMHRAGGR